MSSTSEDKVPSSVEAKRYSVNTTYTVDLDNVWLDSTKRVNFLQDFPDGCNKTQLVLKRDIRNTTLIQPTRSRLKNHLTSTLLMNKPMTKEWNFFEVEILEEGIRCDVAIGIAHSHFPLRSMPGLVSNSIGYHAEDGTAYYDAGEISTRGPSCRRGDIMGCGLNFCTKDNQYVEVWFTRRSAKDGIEKVAIFPQRMDFAEENEGGVFHSVVSLKRDTVLSTDTTERVRYLGHSWRSPPNKHSAYYQWYEVEGYEDETCIPFYNKEESLAAYGHWQCAQKDQEQVETPVARELVMRLKSSEKYQAFCEKFSVNVSSMTRQTWVEEITEQLLENEEGFVALSKAPNGRTFARNEHLALYIAQQVVDAVGVSCGRDLVIPLYLMASDESIQFLDEFAVSGLLYMGYSPNGKLNGSHSFHLAGSLVCMKLLLNWGGDPNAKDLDGKTVLHLKLNNLTLIRMFTAHQGEIPLHINEVNNEGLTPLHVAAKHGLISTAEYLIHNGADPQAKTNRGHTPFSIAANSGYLECFRRMMKVVLHKTRNDPNTLRVIRKWENVCKSLSFKWTRIKRENLEDFTPEQLYVASINSSAKPRSVTDDDFYDSDADSDDEGCAGGEWRWKMGDRISLRRMISLVDTNHKELSVDVVKVLLDLCLFGNRLVMIDILDADIDGYLPQSQRDSSTPSRNQSSLTQSSQRTASERVSLGQEPNTDTFRRKVEGGKRWATPSRNVSFVQYLSEHSSLFYSLISHPTMRTYVNHKWNTVAKNTFWAWLAYYVLQMILLSFALATAARPSLTDQKINSYPDYIDVWRGICEAAVLLITLSKIFDEIIELYVEQWTYFLDVTNYLQWTAVLLTLLLVPLRIIAHPGQWIVASLAYIAHGFRAFYFAAFLKLTGAYIQSLFIIIGRDIFRFMSILLLTLLVFTGSFYLAARYDDSILPTNGTYMSEPGRGRQADVNNLQLTGRTAQFYDVFLIGIRVIAEAESVLDYYSDTKILRPMTILLYLVFLFVVTVILLNVLIAQVSDTYSKVQAAAEGVYLFYRWKIVLRLEQQNQRLKLSSQYLPCIPRAILQLWVLCMDSLSVCQRPRVKEARNRLFKTLAKINCFKPKSLVTIYPKLLWVPGKSPAGEMSKIKSFTWTLGNFFGWHKENAFSEAEDPQDLVARTDELELKLDAVNGTMQTMSQQITDMMQEVRQMMQQINSTKQEHTESS